MRKECDKCGEIEPDNHNESWWLCSCKGEAKSLGDSFKFVMDNFQELWNEVKRQG